MSRAIQESEQTRAEGQEIVQGKVVFACLRGLAFSSEGGSKFTKKVGIKNLQGPPPPISVTKNLWPPHHQYTLLPKQAQIVLKSSLFE